MIDVINVSRESQACVDEMYDKFVKTVHDEMSSKLTPLIGGGRRKNTPYKPYWCEELSHLWKLAHEKENDPTDKKCVLLGQGHMYQNCDMMLERNDKCEFFTTLRAISYMYQLYSLYYRLHCFTV